MRYIQIGRVELFIAKWDKFFYTHGHCGCYILQISWFGITLLSKECARPLDGDNGKD